MGKISKAAEKMGEVQKLQPDNIVVNYMGGDSYTVSPMLTLKMVSASSIFAEPAYYRDGEFAQRKIKDAAYHCDSLLREFDLLVGHDGKTTTQIMEESIDAALDCDFTAVLDWAVELRQSYLMRLNPQVIAVRAAMHPKRKEWTRDNPGRFNEYQRKIMQRADECATQLAYFLFMNKGKKEKMPSILKRSIAARLSSLKRYEVAKYKNHDIGMIDAVRLTHAHSPILDELMCTGTVEVQEDEKTWENLRSDGKTWKEILDSEIRIGHMAKLRNIRGIWGEIDDAELCKEYMQSIVDGVLEGKQFPFRYWQAYKAVEKSECNHKPIILDALERCIDIAIDNMPKLKGKTMCLSDNSGSAWGTFNSEYGTCTIAEIDNLSSVITAMCSDEGYVGKFGDKLIVTPITKRNGALSQAAKITENRDKDVGGSTEGGIWEFFRDALENKEQWDNIIIYSDQQAGHAGLYGTSKHKTESKKMGYDNAGYINVFKLVMDYRAKVNPKVNVFSIQTAGYNNAVIPETAYRCHLLSGWTGKEVTYMDTVIKLWQEIES